MYTRVRDGGGCRGRTGGVGHGRGSVAFVVGFWREWLGRAHLSGMYPSLLHNRGFDACSTCSLHQAGVGYWSLPPPGQSPVVISGLIASITPARPQNRAGSTPVVIDLPSFFDMLTRKPLPATYVFLRLHVGCRVCILDTKIAPDVT